MSKADEIEEFLKFMKVANDVCIEKGKMYEFECPICKEKANAIKILIMGICGQNVITAI